MTTGPPPEHRCRPPAEPGQVRQPSFQPRLPAEAEVTTAKGPDSRMYIFIVDETRQVHVSASRGIEDSSGSRGDEDWSGWLSLGGSFPPGAPLAAVSTWERCWQVFGVDDSQQLVMHAGIGSMPDPAGWQVLPGQEPISLIPGSFVTAISWAGGQWIVFSITDTGSVYAVGTDGGAPTAAMLGGQFEPGAPIAAVTHTPGRWDLFAVGADGLIRTMRKAENADAPSAWETLRDDGDATGT